MKVGMERGANATKGGPSGGRLASLWLALALVGCAANEARLADDALGLDPQDSPASLYVQMVEEYYNRGQREVALRRAQQAVEADAGYPKAHVWLAYLYEGVGQDDLAARHYERALSLAPNNPDVLYAYGSYRCRQQRFEEADGYFQRALANPLHGNRWITLTNAGNCAAGSGDPAKAEQYFRAAEAANPSFGPALVKLAELESARGNDQGAKGYLDRYFDASTLRTPTTARVALSLAVQTERKLGNRVRAAEYERVLRESFPE